MSFIYERSTVVNQFELEATGPRFTNKIMVPIVLESRMKHGVVKDNGDMFR